MAVWIATIIFGATIGAIGGLIENWARDDPIPNWHIILVGVIGAVVGGCIAVAIAGKPVVYAILAGTIIPLYIDRLTVDARRGI